MRVVICQISGCCCSAVPQLRLRLWQGLWQDSAASQDGREGSMDWDELSEGVPVAVAAVAKPKNNAGTNCDCQVFLSIHLQLDWAEASNSDSAALLECFCSFVTAKRSTQQPQLSLFIFGFATISSACLSLDLPQLRNAFLCDFLGNSCPALWCMSDCMGHWSSSYKVYRSESLSGWIQDVNCHCIPWPATAEDVIQYLVLPGLLVYMFQIHHIYVRSHGTAAWQNAHRQVDIWEVQAPISTCLGVALLMA